MTPPNCTGPQLFLGDNVKQIIPASTPNMPWGETGSVKGEVAVPGGLLVDPGVLLVDS